MKRWLLGLVMMLVVMVAAACSGGGEPSASDGGNSGGDSAGGESGGAEEVALDFWVFGATNYEELAAQYMEENPNVTINVRVAETDDHHNGLFTSLSAQSGAPDLAMMEIDRFDKFKQAPDRFVNLYDLGAADLQDTYLDWKWEIGESLDGEILFGLPTDIGPKAMYYNIEVFEEAGLPTEPAEVEELISSVDDFIEVGQTITEKTGKPMVDSMEMAYRAKMDGLEQNYFDEEGNLLIEDPDNGVKDAYDFAVELNDLGIVGEYTMWSAEWANAVNESGFAVELGASWLKGWMSDNAPDSSGKWRVAKLPQELAGNWGGSYITIPAETEHAEATYEFAKWLVAPEQQLTSFLSPAGLFPSAPEVYEMEEFKNTEDEYFGGQSTAQMFADAAQDIPVVYKGPDFMSVNDEIMTALTNVQQGADPEEEWNAAIERINTKLSR